ncbi:MarR family winged helix-turn-helix transcriptional regulator [Azospirillum melinis]
MSFDTFYSRPGHLIRRLNQISVALFFEEAGELGITPRQFAALHMIREMPDIDQGTLSNMVAMDKTTIVKVLERLVEKELITRTRSPTDRRTNVLNVTEAGAKLVKQIEPMLNRSDQRILAPLKRADQKKFMEMLTQLVDVNNIYSRAPLDVDLLDQATQKNRQAATPPKSRRTKKEEI